MLLQEKKFTEYFDMELTATFLLKIMFCKNQKKLGLHLHICLFFLKDRH